MGEFRVSPPWAVLGWVATGVMAGAAVALLLV
jgi:hypothetical protein